MFKLPQSKFPALNWVEIDTLKDTEIQERVKDDPRLHIDNIISQVARKQLPSNDTNATAKKLAKAIRLIEIPSILVRRLFATLHSNKIIRSDLASRFLFEQAKREIALPDILTTHSGLVEKHAALCATPQANLTAKIEQDKHYTQRCIEECTTDVLFAARHGDIKNFPKESPMSTYLFRLLCNHVQRNDYSLYEGLQTLITSYLTIPHSNLNMNRDVDIGHFDSKSRIGFDDFLDNGGNLAKLFSKIDNDLLEARAVSYLEVSPETAVLTNDPAEVIIVLSDNYVRSQWFSKANSLGFLHGSKLIALAQFLDEEITKFIIEIDSCLPIIDKLNHSQQVDFLEALSPMIRNQVAKAYYRHRDQFAAEKQTIVDELAIVLEYCTLDIDNQQKESLAVLKSLANPKNVPNYKNYNEKQILDKTIVHLLNVIRALNPLRLWSNQQTPPLNPKLPLCEQTLHAILEAFRSRAGSLTALSAATLSREIDSAALDGFYLIAVQEMLTSIANRSNINVYTSQDVDWDEFVKVVFRDFKDSTPPKPQNKTSTDAEYKAWMEQIKSILSAYLAQFFDNDISWKEAISKCKGEIPLNSCKQRRIDKDNDIDDDDDDDDDDDAPARGAASVQKDLPANTSGNDSSFGGQDADFESLFAFLDSAPFQEQLTKDDDD